MWEGYLGREIWSIGLPGGRGEAFYGRKALEVPLEYDMMNAPGDLRHGAGPGHLMVAVAIVIIAIRSANASLRACPSPLDLRQSN